MTWMGFIAAFFGGALGTAFGGVNIFIITGIAAIVGVAVESCGIDFSLMNNLAFGAFLGPQITFSAPSVAARFAMSKGWIKSGKDMGIPLVSLGHPSVLVFGGIMGMCGYAINYFWGWLLPGGIDTPAATIFTMCILGKLYFEGNPMGRETEEVKKAGGRYALSAPASWLPWLTYAPQKLLMGLAAGGCAAYLTYIAYGTSIYNNIPALVFGIGALMTLFLISGESVPIPPYMMISASYAVIASGNNFWWGVFFGIVGAFLADFLTKTFYVFGSFHMDPPGMTIATTSFIILFILPKTGIFTVGTWLPVTLVLLYIVYSSIQYIRLKKIGVKIGTPQLKLK